MSTSARRVHVVGGGLAGCEAALQLARFGVPAILHEMRPALPTPAHRTGGLAEIVCSNSLKSTDPGTASGVLKIELDLCGCRLLSAARECALPAGSALAVDRERFSAAVERMIAAERLITIERGEIAALPEDGADDWILATGPLTSPQLQAGIGEVAGEGLHFFDAIAPTVTLESLDLDVLWRASRYDRGGADYLNAPMDRERYELFLAELNAAERAEVAAFDRGELFAGCQPVEEIAAAGDESLRFGPLRPVGLRDPRTGNRPHAVVQLRQENREGTLYGLVGFQTRLKRGEQKRVLRLIPGLENAEFVRYGQLHRNFYLDTPRVLDRRFALPSRPEIRFAGQITGVEGYVESIASGLFTAWLLAAERLGAELPPPPPETVCGALLGGFLRDSTGGRLTPMNANFGLLPPMAGLPRGRRGRKERKLALAERSREAMKAYLAAGPAAALLAAAGPR